MTVPSAPPQRSTDLAAWRAARSVLCIRLDAMGDVLMTTPALRALKQSAPRQLTLLTSHAGAAIAPLIPEIDQVLIYEAPWLKSGAAQAQPAADLDMLAHLRAQRFDAAVIFTVYSQNPLPSALMCYLADIPLRLAHCRENPYRLLTDWLPETEPQQHIRHEVQRQLDLVAYVGATTDDAGLSLQVPSHAATALRARLAAARIDGTRPLVLIHPGASAPSRRYPPALYAQVLPMLIARGLQVVFTGTAADAEAIARIRRGYERTTVSFAGVLDIAELAALIAHADILLCNNSGPAHIAAAVGTPVVDLYALTNPQHTPWQVPARVLSHDVPCKYCYKSECPQQHQRCLRAIEPAAVAAAVIDLLNETRPRSAAALTAEALCTL